MHIIYLTLVALFNLFTSNDWGANGHRIVAQVCEWHLSDGAKRQVDTIIGKEYLAEIANWPDYIKSEKGWKFADSWHYTTVHTDQSVSDMQQAYLKDERINDATEAIDLMISILQGNLEASKKLEKLMEDNQANPLNGSTKATAMAFLVHLVGDIHQPLHVGKNKDRGGNNITVMYFNDRKNLHGIWDTDMIERERLSYSEFSTFINKLDPQQVESLQKDDVVTWAKESIEIREDIYNSIYDYTDRESGLPSFSWKYQHDNLPVIEERLVKAGVRLAGILNEIYE